MLERSHKSLLYTRWSFSACYLVMFAANEESELCHSTIDQACVPAIGYSNVVSCEKRPPPRECLHVLGSGRLTA